jgi:hypothetical protein
VPAEGDASNGALRRIVRQTNPAVLQETDHGVPTAQAVMDRLGDWIFCRELAALFAQPCLKFPDQRDGSLLPRRQPFCR